jgi:hypothetical protein
MPSFELQLHLLLSLVTASEKQLTFLYFHFARATCFEVYMIVVATLFKPFEDPGNSGVMNAYRLGNFIMALALPLTIDNLGHFYWKCVDHDKE